MTAGAALPCSETPVAPHCLRGKVQGQAWNSSADTIGTRPAYRTLSSASTSCPCQLQLLPALEPQSSHLPGTWTSPVLQTPPPFSPLSQGKRSFPRQKAQLKGHLFLEAFRALQPIPIFPDFPPTLAVGHFCISMFKAVFCQCTAFPNLV